MELTPLGILARHGLITEAMYEAAARFSGRYFAVYGEPLPGFSVSLTARGPSDQWPDDVKEAVERDKRVKLTDEKRRDIYDDMAGRA